MKSIVLCCLILLCVFSASYCKDLSIGSSFNNRLIWQNKAEYNAIPLKKRVKEVFYSDPGNQIIKAIVLRDLDHSEAIPSVTAGGPGNSYANIRLKSERGAGLNYQIEIYV